MRVFDHFSPAFGALCPVCKTAADRPTVLVPIPGTEEDGICQARQVHKQCYDLVAEMSAASPSNDADTPRGVKLQLICKADGVATYSTLSSTPQRWDHWAPLPTFAKGD